MAVFWPIFYKINFSYEKQLKYDYLVGYPFLYLQGRRKQMNLKMLGLEFSLRGPGAEMSEDLTEADSKTDDKSDEAFSLTIPALPETIKEIINRDNLRHLGDFIISILKIIKPKEYSLEIFLGTSDPFYDGVFLAIYYSIVYPLAGNQIKLKTGWDEMIFTSRGSAAGRFRISELLYRFLIFILSPQTWRILYKMWEHR